MVTLKDIATKAGVDISTVSKVLQGAPIRVSQAKREEILRIAQEMHYRPNTLARGLRLKKSGAVAMVVPSTTNYLYPEIIGGAEDAAEEHGYTLFLVKHSQRDPLGQLVSLGGQGRVDGFLFPDDVPVANFFERLHEHGIPYISLNRTEGGDGCSVALDDEVGFAAQARYLVSLGHRRIAFVAVTPSSFVSRICERAFLETARGLGVGEESCPVLYCDFGGEGCGLIAEQLLALSPRPTAVATASVLVAVRLVEILRQRGVRVPEDFSVIGYHDSPAATWPRPVSTIKMPSREQGRRGIERLLQVIAGAPFEGEILEAPAEVLERGTCLRRDGTEGASH